MSQNEQQPKPFVKATELFSKLWYLFYVYAYDVGDLLLTKAGLDTTSFKRKKAHTYTPAFCNEHKNQNTEATVTGYKTSILP